MKVTIMRDHNHGASGSPSAVTPATAAFQEGPAAASGSLSPVTPAVAAWVQRTATLFGVTLSGDPSGGRAHSGYDRVPGDTHGGVGVPSGPAATTTNGSAAPVTTTGDRSGGRVERRRNPIQG